jgi:hypothetical protein
VLFGFLGVAMAFKNKRTCGTCKDDDDKKKRKISGGTPGVTHLKSIQ